MLQKPQENQVTRAELATIALARTAIAVNAWASSLSIGTHSFNFAVDATYYAWGSTQYSLIARDIADGINQLTKASIYYCQLPVDRDYIEGFSTQAYLEKTAKDLSCDYLMIDAGSSKTRSFDRNSFLSCAPLSTYSEKALPAQILLTNHDGTNSTYEVVSFCNFERSGMPAQPNVWSRVKESLQWMVANGTIPYESFPTRHATAAVKYGDTWFTACDTCIRQVIPQADASSLDIAQSLLAHYPGMRIIILYKKVDSESAAFDSLNNKGVGLFLKQVSPDSNAPRAENPIVHILGALGALALAAASVMMFKLAHNNVHQVTTHVVGQKIAQAGMRIAFASMILPSCGIAVNFLHNALILHKKKAMVLKIEPKECRSSGLYSSEIESCKAVDIIAPNPENSVVQR